MYFILDGWVNMYLIGFYNLIVYIYRDVYIILIKIYENFFNFISIFLFYIIIEKYLVCIFII